MSIQPVSFNAMSYNYPVARYNSQPIQNPAFRGIEEEQQPKKKSHTGWWVAAGLAVAGIATYLLTRGKAKGAVEKVVKNAENTVNKVAEGTSTAEKTADKVVKNDLRIEELKSKLECLERQKASIEDLITSKKGKVASIDEERSYIFLQKDNAAEIENIKGEIKALET